MSHGEIISAFTALYCGGIAQSLRDSGADPSAVPPWAEVRWLGKQVVKCPMDLWVYQEIIWETKPDLIIETGTNGAGSAWFFAYILDALGQGRICTVDTITYPDLCTPHPRIEYSVGSSLDQEIAQKIQAAAAGKRTMVSLDSLHTYDQVKQELALYAPLVSPGCYLVVEDTGLACSATGAWADKAAYEWVAEHPDFRVDKSRERHLLTSNGGGWILRHA